MAAAGGNQGLDYGSLPRGATRQALTRNRIVRYDRSNKQPPSNSSKATRLNLGGRQGVDDQLPGYLAGRQSRYWLVTV